jgi:ABC-type Fe3+/spermidine/putrescine transport system ATPase subunit
LRGVSDGPFLAADVGIGSGPAVMMIRPEGIELEDNLMPQKQNTVSGHIELREFLGATVRYTINTVVGAITVRSVRVGDAARFKPGDEVRLSWRPENAHLFSSTAGELPLEK